MTPEEQAQKFHTQFDNPSVGRSEYCFWSVDESNFQPIRSTTQIWVVTRHQYGISARFPQASVLKETSDAIAKCRLFSQSASRNIIDLFTSLSSSIFPKPRCAVSFVQTAMKVMTMTMKRKMKKMMMMKVKMKLGQTLSWWDIEKYNFFSKVVSSFFSICPPLVSTVLVLLTGKF